MTFQKMEPILQASQVSLQLDQKLILRDINFTIHNIVRPGVLQGQVVSLVGRSGIGKTQLFKILAGLQAPTAGEVRIGADLHPVQAGEVGVVPQNYILFDHRSVYDNLSIGMSYTGAGYSNEQKEDLIHEYADRFGLREHLKKYPRQLSGGQRQRVSIIQQVLTGNRFILLDEPFSGLDMLMIDKVMELLLQVSTLHEHNTLMIVSHDIENALAISDTAYILAQPANQEGATITEVLDLVQLDLAWKPDIRTDPRFVRLVREIKYKL